MRQLTHESRFLALLRGALVALMVPLAGCNLGTKKQAATPPPPKPAVVQPPAPEAPLSIPQTAVTLPSPQPVNPDAIPAVVTAEMPAPEKVDPPAPVRPSHRPAVSTSKPEPEPEVETPAAPAAQAPIQPILKGDEQKRIQELIESRKHRVEDKLNRTGQRLTSHDKALIERIRSFLGQCEQAEHRGDYSQADALSQRAEILSQELHGE